MWKENICNLLEKTLILAKWSKFQRFERRNGINFSRKTYWEVVFLFMFRYMKNKAEAYKSFLFPRIRIIIRGLCMCTCTSTRVLEPNTIGKRSSLIIMLTSRHENNNRRASCGAESLTNRNWDTSTAINLM